MLINTHTHHPRKIPLQRLKIMNSVATRRTVKQSPFSQTPLALKKRMKTSTHPCEQGSLFVVRKQRKKKELKQN